MSDKNIEMMKKIIEAKKQKNSTKGGTLRAEKTIGSQRGSIRSSKKTGGVFDKG